MNERDSDSLVARFTARLWAAVDVCINEYNYHPRYYIRMIIKHGSMETARQLIMANHYHEGFARLCELKRLNLTIESIVLEPEFEPLFSPELINEAQKRLNEYRN